MQMGVTKGLEMQRITGFKQKNNEFINSSTKGRSSNKNMLGMISPEFRVGNENKSYLLIYEHDNERKKHENPTNCTSTPKGMILC